MPEIPFTQFIMPNGREREILIDRPDDVATKARELFDLGYWFECEMLSDYKSISLTIEHTDAKQNCSIEVVPNGPEVPEAVDRMILSFNPEE